MYDYDRLNELLVTTLQNISDTEVKCLLKDDFKDITINDMHILEAIGQKTPQNMSSVATKLKVTVGTLTIAINHLVKKGYVTRNRGEQDRRVVFLSLSEKGTLAFQKHMEFHKNMTLQITKDLSEKELELLMNALKKLSSYSEEQKNL
ncbi:MAG: MarR family transcriptional regulator [Lachnospiraceae bacterium]|nr:MarR family transcriptional regulator [Lachnospiraceae bacterium]